MSEAARSPFFLTTRASASPRVLIRVAGAVACALYLAPGVFLPPNHSDGGLLLDYIRLMAEGQRPFWDFIDAYGPLNWVVPVLAYRLAGEQVWGIALSVAVTKLASIPLGFALVHRLAGALPAWLAAFWLTMLLGAPWQLLQTPYAMHPVLTIELAVWLLLLAPPRVDGVLPAPSGRRILLAGALTGAALWIKVNAGAFLLAGGLFYCFYWLPPRGEGAADRAAGRDRPDGSLPLDGEAAVPDRPTPAPFRLLWSTGLAVYALVFLGFVGKDWPTLFFPYLIAPLFLVLGTTAVVLRRSPPGWALALERLRAWGLFLFGTSAVALGFFLAYFGVEGGLAYVRELAPILAGLEYEAPFPALGEAGLYVGFTEFYWPQLPWLVTLAFVALGGLSLARRPQSLLPVPRAVWVGLFALFSFQAFVIYSRADEAHLVQAVWPAAPVSLALLGALWNELRRPVWLTGALAAGVIGLGLPLAVPPSGERYRLDAGPWHSPHLRYLGFHPESSPYIREYSEWLSNYDWDVEANAAARHIDRVTEDGSVILVTLRNQLLHLNSNTRAFGGRHRFLFYLLSMDLITWPTFRALLPPEVKRELLADPPAVIVTAFGSEKTQLFLALPELERFFRAEYELTGMYAHIMVHERKDRPDPP